MFVSTLLRLPRLFSLSYRPCIIYLDIPMNYTLLVHECERLQQCDKPLQKPLLSVSIHKLSPTRHTNRCCLTGQRRCKGFLNLFWAHEWRRRRGNNKEHKRRDLFTHHLRNVTL